MNGEPTVDSVDRWLKFTSNYGLSFVFLACFLLIILWLAITIIGLMKKWVPIWFASSIRTQKRTVVFLDQATDTLSCLHDKTHGLAETAYHITQAALTAARKGNEKFGSDVMVHLENAANSAEQTIIRRNYPKRRVEDSVPEEVSENGQSTKYDLNKPSEDNPT